MQSSELAESETSKELTELENDIARVLETAANALNLMDALDGDAVSKSATMWKSFVGQVENLRSSLVNAVMSCPKPIEYDNTELYLAYADMLSFSKQTSLLHERLQDLKQFIDKPDSMILQ